MLDTNMLGLLNVITKWQSVAERDTIFEFETDFLKDSVFHSWSLKAAKNGP